MKFISATIVAKHEHEHAIDCACVSVAVECLPNIRRRGRRRRRHCCTTRYQPLHHKHKFASLTLDFLFHSLLSARTHTVTGSHIHPRDTLAISHLRIRVYFNICVVSELPAACCCRCSAPSSPSSSSSSICCVCVCVCRIAENMRRRVLCCSLEIGVFCVVGVAIAQYIQHTSANNFCHEMRREKNTRAK